MPSKPTPANCEPPLGIADLMHGLASMLVGAAAFYAAVLMVRSLMSPPSNAVDAYFMLLFGVIPLAVVPMAGIVGVGVTFQIIARFRRDRA